MSLRSFASGVALGVVITGAFTTVNAPVSGVHVYYSLDDKRNDERVISLIDDAQKSVHFAIYTFTRSSIADALIAAKARGVDVSGVVDREQAKLSSELPILDALRAAGIPLVYDTHQSGIMHIKTVVTEKAYATGSYNWTTAATLSNDEVLEIGTDENLRSAYGHIVDQVIAANQEGVFAASPTALGTTVDLAGFGDLKAALGKDVSLSVHVYSVAITKSKTTFLDLCENYKGCALSLVVFASDLPHFSDLTLYKGKNLVVKGKVELYKGAYEIILHDESQLSLAELRAPE